MSRQRTTPTIPHPALLEHTQERARNIQNRIADRITAYAGSMHFVYLHVLLFAVWRADEKRQALASQDWESVQLEEKQNEQLLDLSRQILDLTSAIHQLTVRHTGASPLSPSSPPGTS